MFLVHCITISNRCESSCKSSCKRKKTLLEGFEKLTLYLFSYQSVTSKKAIYKVVVKVVVKVVAFTRLYLVHSYY